MVTTRETSTTKEFVQVRLSPEDRAYLDSLARDGVTKSDVVRSLLRRHRDLVDKGRKNGVIQFRDNGEVRKVPVAPYFTEFR